LCPILLLAFITNLVAVYSGIAQYNDAKFQERWQAADAFHQKEFQRLQSQWERLIRYQPPSTTDSADYDAIFYDLNFTVPVSPPKLIATVRGVFRSRKAGLQRIILNFDSREDITPWENLTVTGKICSKRIRSRGYHYFYPERTVLCPDLVALQG